MQRNKVILVLTAFTPEIFKEIPPYYMPYNSYDDNAKN